MPKNSGVNHSAVFDRSTRAVLFHGDLLGKPDAAAAVGIPEYDGLHALSSRINAFAGLPVRCDGKIHIVRLQDLFGGEFGAEVVRAMSLSEEALVIPRSAATWESPS